MIKSYEDEEHIYELMVGAINEENIKPYEREIVENIYAREEVEMLCNENGDIEAQICDVLGIDYGNSDIEKIGELFHELIHKMVIGFYRVVLKNKYELPTYIYEYAYIFSKLQDNRMLLERRLDESLKKKLQLYFENYEKILMIFIYKAIDCGRYFLIYKENEKSDTYE